jgi:hypothetical protein
MMMFTRLTADVAAVLPLLKAQDTRIALREDTRLSLYPMATVPAWMGAYAPGGQAVEIVVDGRGVGVAFGSKAKGWMFTVTNEDGAALNEEMVLAVDAALVAGATGHCIEADTVATFNRWGALAKATSDARSQELFGV